MSLFAEQRIVELRLPTGKPGRVGGDAIVSLVEQDRQYCRPGCAAQLQRIALSRFAQSDRPAPARSSASIDSVRALTE